MADHARYVVIGSGAAGTRAAETLRRRDRDARIVVVAEDPHPFYNRTLLSKAFLKDDRVAPADLILKPADAYAAQGIELRAGARVVRLDPGAHT
ncbi:MAG: FAD-dependent oxidoreductase, partial [Gemmatimonadetes bacterium]|nr:FAD-dependent oxidoreductase [Gemmatimonadota bacterium]